LTYPSDKYESQLGLLFPIYGKIKAMIQTTNQKNIENYFVPVITLRHYSDIFFLAYALTFYLAFFLKI